MNQDVIIFPLNNGLIKTIKVFFLYYKKRKGYFTVESNDTN